VQPVLIVVLCLRLAAVFVGSLRADHPVVRRESFSACIALIDSAGVLVVDAAQVIIVNDLASKCFSSLGEL